jgi:hypothetical protein
MTIDLNEAETTILILLLNKHLVEAVKSLVAARDTSDMLPTPESRLIERLLSEREAFLAKQ